MQRRRMSNVPFVACRCDSADIGLRTKQASVESRLQCRLKRMARGMFVLVPSAQG
jgi:hypothetical protein